MKPEEYLKEFTKIVNDMIDTTERKNHDYAGSVDAFANFKLVEKMNVTSVEVGILTRMTDKFGRISNFISQGNLKVKDESVYDTLKDLAVYSIILAIYLKNKKDVNLLATDNSPLNS